MRRFRGTETGARRSNEESKADASSENGAKWIEVKDEGATGIKGDLQVSTSWWMVVILPTEMGTFRRSRFGGKLLS